MDRSIGGELEGQTSINEWLDEPVGVAFIQLVLPLHIPLPEGKIRRL
ncbi:hypothetical protein GU243_00505 [Pseudarthrobacter psychrotolerans]|uniref:Uncharacterized protein n=1 Tax=Pseudarthrobacter psychrotolerans TaxID=2697569 RepID=A0A6P1NE31_9MICC|nr:hypothetical protein [Pseudarthrobacter psychrotolerans]QHK18516.1 hypothetical protein GU243_00505 [Pseudarthrobacter psychrotolerans]